MNRNMFSPEMMNQMKHMINPQMMKQAADQFSGMTDEQIGSYLAASGMGHISPSMFRQMSGNLKNMDDKDLDRVKNNANYPAGGPTVNNNPSSVPINTNNSKSTPTPTPTTKTTPSPTPKDSSYSNYEPSRPKTIIEKLEEIKNKGNEHFRKGLYKEACEKYYEALNELEYIPDSDKVNLKKPIEDLEIVCRLNIANSKLKLEDYDLTIHECLKVLKKTENFKAHYRAAVSFYKKGNHSKAKLHFTKAREVNQTEEAKTIENYLKECDKFINDLENENDMKTAQVNAEKEKEKRSAIPENLINVISEVKTEKIEKTQKTEKEVNTSTGPKSKIDKLKEIVKSDVKPDDEILIEEEKPKKKDLISEEASNSKTSHHNNINNNSQLPNFSNPSQNNPYNNEMFTKAEKELSNMVNLLFDNINYIFPYIG